MWLVWDIIAVVTIVLFVFVGAKQGFMRTLVSVLCYLIAAVIARKASLPMSTWLYDSYLSGAISNLVAQKFQEILGQGLTGSELISIVPTWLAGLLFMVYPNIASMSMDSFFEQSGDGIAESSARLVDMVLREPVITLFEWIFFLILFFVLSVAIKQLAKLFTGINKIPVVGTLNMIAGAFFGGIQSLIILTVLAVIVSTVGVMSGGEFPLFSPLEIQSSIIMGNLYRIVFG